MKPARLASVAQSAKGLLRTEVEGTAAELARLRDWLAIVDLAPRAAPPPSATIAGAKAREAPARMSAVVALRYGEKPPGLREPIPEEKPPAGK